MIHLGIDPGQSGGIVVIWDSGIHPRVTAHKMPATEKDVWEIFEGFVSTPDRLVPPCQATIERVHSMPRQGVASSFKFGRGFGGLLMALTAANIPITEVNPQVWQRALGCLSKGDKNVTKRRAQQLFPHVPKITHAIADALLIAEYGRRTGGGN